MRKTFAVLAGLLLITPTVDVHDATAFTSAYTGAGHRKITAEALNRVTGKNLKYPSPTLGPADYVEFVDWENAAYSGTYGFVQHFDRTPSRSNTQVFRDSRAEMVRAMDKAVAFAQVANFDSAAAYTGRVLHAAQDFFAHSNYVDLNASEKSQAMNALTQGGSVPQALVFTSFDPSAQPNPEDPADPLNFTHWKHSKDCRNSDAARKGSDEQQERLGQEFDRNETRLREINKTTRLYNSKPLLEERDQLMKRNRAILDSLSWGGKDAYTLASEAAREASVLLLKDILDRVGRLTPAGPKQVSYREKMINALVTKPQAAYLTKGPRVAGALRKKLFHSCDH